MLESKTSTMNRNVVRNLVLAVIALATMIAMGSIATRAHAEDWPGGGGSLLPSGLSFYAGLADTSGKPYSLDEMKTLKVGDTVTYRLDIVNKSAADLESVDFLSIYEVIGGTRYPAGSLWTIGSNMSCTPSTGTMDPFPVGATMSCQSDPFQILPSGTETPAGGVLSYFAKTTQDANSVNYRPFFASMSIVGTTKVELKQNEPTITTARTDGAVEPGDKISYSFVATNTGTLTWTPTQMTDDLGRTYSCSPMSVPEGGTTTCTSPAYTVTSADLAKSTVTNKGHITVDSSSGTPVTADSNETEYPVKDNLVAGSIQLTKSGPATAPRGSTVSYTLTVKNPGELPTKEAARITDPLPVQFVPSSVSASSATGTINASGGVVTWNIPAGLAANTEVTATVQGTLDPSILAGANVINTATVADGECVGTCSSQVTTSVTETQGKVTLTKTAPGSQASPVHPGTPVTYQLKVENSGSVPLKNITVSDDSDPFVADPVVCPGTNNATIPNLAVGAAVTCTLTHTFDQTDLAAATTAIINEKVYQYITNQASVRAEDANGVPVEDSTTARTYLDVKTDLSVTKTSTAPTAKVKAGDTIRYRIALNYSADSEMNLNILQFADAKLPNMRTSCTPTVPATITPGFSTVCEGTGTDYVVTEADIRDNWADGVVPNAAYVSAQLNPWRHMTLNPNGYWEQPIDKDTPMVAFSGSKVADKTSAVPGDTITYTVKAKNTGQLTATNVVLKDAFKGAAAAPIDPTKCVWPTASGTLKPNEEVTCTYTYLVTDADANSTITNRATAEGTNGTEAVGPTDLGNTSVPVASGVNLSATKTASVGNGARVKPGQAFDYTITVRNDGGSIARGVKIEDQLPAGLSFAPTSQTGWTFTGQHAVTAAGSEFDVPAGGGEVSKTFSVTVDSDARGETKLVNVAVVQGMATLAQCTADSTIQGCAVHTAGVVVDDSSLTISKENSITTTPRQVKKGQTFTYDLVVKNEGVSPVTGVTITDRLPAGLAFSTPTQDGWASPLTGNTAVSLPFNLGNGGQTTLHLSVTVTDTAVAGATLQNTAALDPVVSIAECLADTSQTKKGCAWDQTPVQVVDHSMVSITKVNDITGSPKKVRAGDIYTYTVTVKNTSTTKTAYAVQVSDTIDSTKLQFYGTQADVWRIDASTISLKTPVTLGPGEEKSYDIVVQVLAGASGTIRNVAVLDDQDPGACPPDAPSQNCGPDTDPPTVDNTALSLTKTSEFATAGTKVKPGQQYTYTLTAKNTGAEAATNVVVTDQIPAGVEFFPATQPGWSFVSGTGQPGSIIQRTIASVGANGATQSVTFTVKVLANATANSTIRNVGTVGPTSIADCVDDSTRDGCAEDSRKPVVDNSHIVIEKTNDVANADKYVKLGDTFRYTIAVSNSGATDASNVVIVDQLPAGLAFASTSQAGWVSPLTGNTATSSPLTIPGGGAKTYLYLDVRVVAPAKAGDVLTNVAAVQGVATPSQCIADDTRTLDGCAWDDSELTVVDHSAVTITKKNDVTGTPKLVKVGDSYTYTITVKNTSTTQTAYGVKVSDTISSKLVFDGAQADVWRIDGSTISLKDPITLLPQAEQEFSFKVKVAPGASGSITNVAVLDDQDPANCPTNAPSQNCGPDTDPPTVDNTELTLKKVNNLGTSKRVKPGQKYSYTLTARNNGSETATGVQIVDQIPQYTQFVATDSPDWEIVPGSGTGGAGTQIRLKTPLSVGPNGTEVARTFTVQVLDTAPAETSIRNVATVGPTSITDCIADSTKPGCAEDQNRPVVDDSSIQITKTNDVGTPALVKLGQEFTYTIGIRNTGTSDASNVVITDQLPAGLAFASATQAGWNSLSGQTATSLGLSIPGGSPEVYLTLKVKVVDPAKAGDVLTNIGAVNGMATPAECLADSTRTKAGCAWDDNQVTVIDHSKVTITKTNDVPGDPKLVRVNDTYTYSIEAHNGGTEIARAVYLSDTLASGLIFNGSQAPWTVTGNTAHIQIDIAPGDTAKLTLRVRVVDGASGRLNNVVVMDDQDPSQCSLTTAQPGCGPDLDPPTVDNTKVSLTKQNELGTNKRVKPGQDYAYTLIAKNEGSETATGVQIVDQIPQYTTFNAAASPLWEIVPGTGTGAAGTQIRLKTPLTVGPNGATQQVQFTVTVTSDARAEASIRNVATAGPTPISDCIADSTKAGCAEDQFKPVVDNSSIVITKTNDVANTGKYVKLGDTFRYTIAIENTGDSVASAVQIVDQLPSGLAFASATQSGWVSPLSGQSATSASLSIPGRTTTYLYLDVTVVDPAKAGDVLTNIGAVTGMATPAECLADTTKTKAGCAWDSTPVTVIDHSGVVISKTNNVTGSPKLVRVGDSYTYTITVRNDGTRPALGVKVSDTIDTTKLEFDGTQAAVWQISGATISLRNPIDLAPNAEQKFDIKVRVLDGASGVIYNVAVIDDQDPGKCSTTTPEPGCGPDTDPPTVDNSNVSITKTNNVTGNRVKVGQEFIYTFTLTNSGTEAATNVSVTDLLPAGLEVYPANQSPTWKTFNAATRQIQSGPVTVPARGETKIDLSVRVAAGTAPLTQLVNVGSIDGTTPVDQCLATTPLPKGCAKDDKPLVVDDSDVTIAKWNSITDTPKQVRVNDTFTYTVRASNSGSLEVTNVVITDQIPAGLAFDGSQDTSKWATATPTGTTITSVPLTVPAKGYVDLPIKVKVVGAATVGSKPVNVAAIDGKATPAECLADTTQTKIGCAWDDAPPTVVDHSKVTVTKSNDLPGAAGTQPRVVPGQTFTYTITATNTDAAAPAKGVVLHDTLPTGLDYVLPLDTRWVLTLRTITTEPALDIPAGGKVVIPVTVKVADNAQGTLRNVAVMDSQDPSQCDVAAPSNACGVDPRPPYVDTVKLTKKADYPTVKPGGTITYTFTADNTAGTADVKNYRIIDSIPDGASLDPNPQTGWTIVSGTGLKGTVVQTTDPFTVGAGAKVTKTLTVKVDADAASGKVIKNVATMDGGRTPIDQCVIDPAKPDCVSDSTNPVVDDSAIQLKKTNDIDRTPATVQAGDTYTYAITVTNTGDTPASGIHVTDLLPAGLAFDGVQDSQWQTPSGQTIQSVALTVTKGSPLTLPIKVKVLDSARVDSKLTNVVALDGTATPAACLADTARTMKGCAWDDNEPTVVDHSSVTVTKSNSLTGNPPKVHPGQTFTYTVTATNSDPTVNARNVTVSDTLPVGLSYVLPLDARWNAPVGQKITSKPFDVAKGSSVSIPITVKVDDNAQGTLRNVAVKDSDPVPDCNSTPRPEGCDPNPPDVDTVKLSKKAGYPTVKPGETVTYTFTADNTAGTADVKNYRIIDSIPDGASLDPNPQTGWSIVSGSGTRGTVIQTDTPFTVPAGGVVTKTLTVKIDADAPSGKVIKNVATMEGGRTPIDECVIDPTKPDCVSDSTNPVVDDSAIQLKKTNDITRTPATVIVGDTYTYSITVTNTGATPATGVQVTDQLPAGLAFDGTQDSQWNAPSGQTIQSKALTVTKGSPITLPIKVKVLDTAAVNTTLTNVVAHDGAATPAACLADTTRTMKGCAWDDNAPRVVDHSAVKVTKSNSLTGNPPMVKVGDTFTYTITATNTDASVAARNVTVKDQLPAGLTWVLPLDARWNAPVGQVITSKPFDLAPNGTLSIPITVKVADGADGTLKNVAVKDSDPIPDCDSTPKPEGCDPNPPDVDTVVPSKTSSVADGARVKPGDTVTYTLHAKNTGKFDVKNYGFIDQVPVGMVLDPVSQAGWKLTKGAGEAGSVVQSEPLFTVPAGTEVTKTLVMKVDSGAKNGLSIRNVGTIVDGDTPIDKCVLDPTLPDCFEEPTDHAVDDSVIQIAKTNDVKQSHKQVKPGDSFTYTITVTNTGNSDATGVRITDEIPAGLSFATGQDSVWGTPSGRTIQSTPLTVKAGVPLTLPIKVTVNDGATGTLVNVAAVDGMATIADCKADPNHVGCATDKQPVTVDNTNVSAKKTASIDESAEVKPGQSYSYTIVVTNSGTQAATAVTVTDKLPTGLILDPAKASPDFSSPAVAGVVRSQPFDLAANGGTKTLTLNVKVDPNVAAGTVIKNVGSVKKATDDGPSIDECVADPTLPQCFEEDGEHPVNDSNVTIVKRNSLSGTPPQVLVGDTFTYQVVATNSGISEAKDITVTDLLPAGLIFSGTQDSAWQTPSGQSITSKPFTLAGKDTRTLTLTVKVDTSATVGGTLRNVAAVDSKATPAECLAGTKTDGCAIDDNSPKVVDHSKVIPFKTNSLQGNPPRVVPGDTYTYTVGARNTDTSVARNVVISDTLPDGLELTGTQDSRWIISNGNRTLTYSTDIAAGATVSLPINVRVAATAEGTIYNVVVIDGDDPGECDVTPRPAGCDENPPGVDTVTPSKTSSIADGARVRPGDPVTYTLHAKNSGKTDVKNYGFIDQVPAGMVLDPTSQTGWKITSGTGAAGTVVQSEPLFTVPAGQEVTKTLTMKVAANAADGTRIRNVGTVVNGKTPIDRCVADPTLPDCFEEPTDHGVDDSDIHLLKTNDVTQSHKLVSVGQVFSYTIKVSNTGKSQATGVTITDKLPTGLAFEGTQDTNFWGTPSGQTIQSKALTIDGGKSLDLTLKVKVQAGANGTLTNVSAVDGKVTPEECLANPNLSGCGVDISPVKVDNTALSATKVPSIGANDPVKPGQSFSYTFTAKNTGSQAATGVRITDRLPQGLQLDPAVSQSATWTYDAATRTVTSVAFDLPAVTGSKTLVLAVKVLDGAADGTVIKNVGSITKPEDDGPSIDECVADPTLPQCFEEDGDHSVDDSNITITKTNGLSGNPPLVTAGQTYTYTLVVRNEGNTVDNHVVVTDLLPNGLTFEPSTQSGWTISGNKATSAVLTLAGHTQATLHLSVKVGTGMATGTVLKNVSAADGSTSGGTPVDECVVDGTKPGCGPDKNPPEVVDHSKVKVTKANSLGDKPVVRVGDSYTYTITATNTGAQPVAGVVVSDTLPAGLAFDGLQSGWTITGNTASFTTDLSVGQSVTKSLTVRVVPGASGTLHNAVVKDDDKVPDCNSDPKPENCDPNPPGVDNTDVTITKVSDLGKNARVKPGQEFTYTITAKNSGTDTAKGVKITDTLPAGLEFNPTSQAGWTLSGTTATSDPFDLGPNGGTKVMTLKVRVKEGLKAGTEIVNTACTTGMNTDKCGDDPNPPTFDDSKIQLAKSNDTEKTNRQVKVGDTFTYTIAATNTGEATAQNVVIVDTLPVGLEFTSTTQSGWATISGRTATSAPLDIAGGKTVSLTLSVKVSAGTAAGTVLKNASAVDGIITPPECLTDPTLPGCGVDPNPPSVEDHTKVTIAKTSSQAGKIVKPGTSYTYTITVKNEGTLVAHGVKVSDTLPAGLTFDGAQDGAWTVSGQTASTTIDSLGVGATQTFTLRVKVAAGAPNGALKNVAVIDDRVPEDCLTNPSLDGCGVDPNPPRVDGSDVKLSKSNSLNGAATVKPGQVFSYTITATNAGTGAATDQKIVDVIPAGLEFYPTSQSGWVFDGSKATATIPTLAPSASVSLTLQVRVKADIANNALIQNAARALDPTKPDDDQDPADCLTDPTLPGCGVDPKPPIVDRNVMQIEKTHNLAAGSLLVNKGQPFGYTIKVTNLGYLDATGVAVHDRLPDGVQWASTSQPGWSSISGADAIASSFNVPAGTSKTLTIDTVASKTSSSLLRNVVALSAFQLQGANSVMSGSGVAGGASISAPTGDAKTIEQCVLDPNQAGCAYDDIAGSGTRAGVSITKSNNVANGTVKVGDTFSYTITVKNSTSATSKGITVSDTLPTGLAFADGQDSVWTISGNKASLTEPFDLGAGESRSFTLKVTVTADAKAGTIRNVAVMDDTNPDDCLVNPSLPGCGVDPNPPIFDPGESVLSLVKSGAVTDVNLNGKVDAGDTIDYTFTVTNTGTKTADAGVQIIDPMLQAAGISIVCDSSEIPPGESITCKASAPYVITVQDQMAGKVRNVAAAVIGDNSSRPAEFVVTTSGEIDCSLCNNGSPTPTPTSTLPTTGGGGNGTPGGGGGTLPYTGVEITAMIAAALALLAAGVLALLARRRRTQE